MAVFLPRRLLGLFHVLVLGVLLVANAPSVAAMQAIPALTTPVTDLTQTLSPEQQQALAAKLLAFEQEKGSQIAVLVVPSTQPEDIAQYSIRVADAWKIGREKQDDGVLLLVAKNDRKVRIEVGRGLEGAIPDIYAKRIIAEHITPLFKQNDYYGGLSAGIDKLMALIAGEQLPAPAKTSAKPNIGFDSAIGLFLMACIFVGSFFTGILGRFFGSAATGGVVGGVSGLALGLASGLTVGILAFVFTLFIPALFSSGATSSGRRSGGGYYGGGSWGGGSGSWGGGGGSFGGGGASGDW